MTFTFQCELCARKLFVAERYAFQIVRCPICGKRICEDDGSQPAKGIEARQALSQLRSRWDAGGKSKPSVLREEFPIVYDLFQLLKTWLTRPTNRDNEDYEHWNTTPVAELVEPDSPSTVPASSDRTDDEDPEEKKRREQIFYGGHDGGYRSREFYEWMHQLYPDGSPRSEEWRRLSDEAKFRDGRKCLRCGSTERLQAHHIEPLSKGGINGLSNLETLCHMCHQETHGFTFGFRSSY